MRLTVRSALMENLKAQKSFVHFTTGRMISLTLLFQQIRVRGRIVICVNLEATLQYKRRRTVLYVQLASTVQLQAQPLRIIVYNVLWVPILLRMALPLVILALQADMQILLDLPPAHNVAQENIHLHFRPNVFHAPD